MTSIIFMTGATSGLGKISALEAAKSGSTVLVLARSEQKGRELLDEFEKVKGDSSGSIKIFIGNLTDLNSIVKACEKLAIQYPRIDMIVNNAGIMSFERSTSIDNIEETLQVNLLAPILITHLLSENISSQEGGKIIFTSSGLHQGNINFKDIEFRESFSAFKVYRQSKLGVILICRLLAPILQKENISIFSQHPGVVKTDLGRNASWFMRIIFNLMGSSPEKGSQTLTYLINTPKNELSSGEYYANKKITKTTAESYDLAVAEKLLDVCKNFLKDHLKRKSPIFP